MSWSMSNSEASTMIAKQMVVVEGQERWDHLLVQCTLGSVNEPQRFISVDERASV